MANAAGQAVISDKDATIAQLRSEKYADKLGIEVYQQSKTDNNNLRDNIIGDWIKPIAQESAANRERIAVLETQVACDREKAALREQIINQKIDCVADKAAAGIAGNSASIAHLGRIVDSITALHVPASAICPEPMPRWNSFTVPTNDAPATQPISGSINVTRK